MAALMVWQGASVLDDSVQMADVCGPSLQDPGEATGAGNQGTTLTHQKTFVF